MLSSTARSDASNDRMAVGSGIVDGWGALNAGAGLANVGVAPSDGSGSLEASRGSVGVMLDDLNGTVLDAQSGELTQQLLSFDPNALTQPWDGSSWFGSSWFGSSWFGSSWFGSSWFGSSWFGSSWFGQPSGTEDYGSSWFGSSWFGSWDQ
jgi:hypothetical protein